MIYLLSTILLNVLIFIIFRTFTHFKINTFQAVVINYIVCTCIGIYFLNDPNQLVLLSPHQIWVQAGAILGVLFVIAFYLIAYSTQLCGISTTTVSYKMSLIIPVYFSLFVFGAVPQTPDIKTYLAIGLSLLAIIFTSIKPTKKAKGNPSGFFAFLLPVLVFGFGGIIDTLINYAKIHILSENNDKLFTTLIFIVASFTGLIILIGKVLIAKEKIDGKSLFAGLLLGIPNFFSIYYLIKTLREFNNDGAFVYPVANIGIIIVSGVISVIIFKEKLSTLNQIGIGVAIIALVVLAHKEILQFFIH